jgi:hypothetical protein
MPMASRDKIVPIDTVIKTVRTTDELELMRGFAKEPDYLPDDNTTKNRLRRLRNAGTIVTQLVSQVEECPRKSDGANLFTREVDCDP